MSDNQNLVMRVLIGEYGGLPTYERTGACWVMAGDMWMWLRSLFPVSPASSWRDFTAGFSHEVMLGLPIELRDGVEGIHLEEVG